MLKQFETVLLILILLPFAYAKISYLGIDSRISGNFLNIRITVYKPPKNFTMSVPFGVLNFSSNSNCSVEGKKIICTDVNVSSLNIFLVQDSITSEDDSKKVAQQYGVYDSIEKVTSILTLPVGSILTNRSDVVYPIPYKTLSNGRNIIVYWEFSNVSSYQPLMFQVYYQPAVEPFNFGHLWKWLKIVIIVVGAISIFLYSVIRERSKRKTEEMILEVLDEYEKKIFDIVKEKKKIKQRELVSITGFSKARVSRVVKALVKKGLITSEKRGRNNIIKIKRKFVKEWE